jgi:hypothetical protein
MDTPNHIFQILDIISKSGFEEPKYSLVSQYALNELSQKFGTEIFENCNHI